MLIEGDMEGSQGGPLLLLSHPCDKIFPNMVSTLLQERNMFPGAHNDVRAEGNGRSVQQSCKRLKFENILMVVLLLFLARMCIASLTDYSTGKVAKFIVRYKIVHKGQRICIPAVINSRKAKGKVLLP